MKPFTKVVKPFLIGFGALFVGVGALAAFWAFANLVGLPMVETSTMDARSGWIGFGISLFSFTAAGLLFKKALARP